MAGCSKAVLNALHLLTDATDTVLLDGVAQATGLDKRRASETVTRLIAHGLLARVLYADGTIKRGVYRLTADGRYALESGAVLMDGRRGPTVKRHVQQDTLRDRVWRLLRIRRKLSVPEAVSLLLDGAATRQELAGATDNVQSYLRTLRRAGYLTDMRRGPSTGRGSSGAKRYLLVRDCGPLAPVHRRRDRTVFDPNTGEAHELA